MKQPTADDPHGLLGSPAAPVRCVSMQRARHRRLVIEPRAYAD
jgi:hypothetical protein